MNTKRMSTKTMVTIAMLTAASYILEATIHFPIFPSVTYIQYSPSEIPIVIGGMIFGPLAALLSSLAVALLAGITVGTTGIIGMLINFLSKASFAVLIAAIFKSRKTNVNMIIAFVVGSIAMVCMMVLSNIALTPLYTGVPISVIMGMLIPTIIPINAIMAVINSVLSIVIYLGISKYVKDKQYDRD